MKEDLRGVLGSKVLIVAFDYRQKQYFVEYTQYIPVLFDLKC